MHRVVGINQRSASQWENLSGREVDDWVFQQAMEPASNVFVVVVVHQSTSQLGPSSLALPLSVSSQSASSSPLRDSRFLTGANADITVL